MPDILSRWKSHLFEINMFYLSYAIEATRSDKFLASGSYFVGSCGNTNARNNPSL
jgi:hypothetical protein